MFLRLESIDVWTGDPDHVIDVISNFTKLEIEDQRNQARQLEDVMDVEICDSSISACFGHRCTRSKMQIGLIDTSNASILEISTSSETQITRRPIQIRLSTSSDDYVIHDSYIWKIGF